MNQMTLQDTIYFAPQSSYSCLMSYMAPKCIASAENAISLYLIGGTRNYSFTNIQNKFDFLDVYTENQVIY